LCESPLLGIQVKSQEFLQGPAIQTLLGYASLYNGEATNTYGMLTTAAALTQSMTDSAAETGAPIVTGLSETNGSLADAITISGKGLCNVHGVYFGNAAASFRVNSATNISATVPEGTGFVDVRLVSPGGVSQITCYGRFLYGQGTTNPGPVRIISLSGTLAFGSLTVGTSAQSTLTISNGGNATLTVSGITYPNGFSGNWSGTVPAGGWQNVTVTFSPTAAVPYGGTVTVNTDATGGADRTTASGTGVNAPPPAATRIIDVVGNLDFGCVQVNTTNSRAVTIDNVGTTNLDISSIGCPPGFSAAWSGTIWPDNPVTITVSFSPTAITSYTGTVAVISDATSGTSTIQATGIGVPVPPPSPVNPVPVGPFETIYSFSGSDGSHPNAGLVEGGDGSLYGTTWQGGGGAGLGTVFRITPTGQLTILHSFGINQGGLVTDNDGGSPGQLLRGADGNLYATTQAGGPNGGGTVFRVASSGVFSTLVAFSSAPRQPSFPGTTLAQGSNGRLYGETKEGGTNQNRGTIFEVGVDGSLSSPFSFNRVDGAPDIGFAYGLVRGADGNLYGTTGDGGPNFYYGTIFEIGVADSFSGLFSFSGTNGILPDSLMQSTGGSFYGTTAAGGTNGSNGTIFRFTPGGGLASIYSFTGGADGASPQGALAEATDGNLYGTTYSGGSNGCGTVFRFKPSGAFTTLHSFAGGQEGAGPMGALVQGPDGNLYGTTSKGGAKNAGTVFRLIIPPDLQTVTRGPTVVTLAWATSVGQIYQVQYTTDLGSGNWVNLTSPMTAASTTMTVSDGLVPNQHRLYRIVLTPRAW
jgi:uncharacterized repeat protein (TIGR03803 family)